MMNSPEAGERIFDKLRNKMAKRLLGTGEQIRIRSVWATEFCCHPAPDERVFKGYLVVAQSSGQGCCLSDDKPEVDFNIVGEDALNHIRSCDPVSIAILDSLYNSLRDNSGMTVRISGDPSIKAQLRGELVAKEALRLIGTPTLERTAVVIGFVGKIAAELLRKGFRVFGTDQSKDIIGKSYHGITVDDSSYNETYIQRSRIAVVTGMVLRTNSLDEILDMANKYETKVLIFAQTGASLAKEYLEFGAHTVIAEPFPIYDFHGESIIVVHRRGEQGTSPC